ncbi:hypothetical protein [Nitratireductor sp. ZSWI3]|uniref:hypothetical protein n=1 Tax=Nitratireductor sp. ZSWI3 TaxID=2966359 RepID=UPI00214FF30C|nr:hypothetical protein [Nitratireductor sp. ZSWI3]MCR4268812.1 hypothetical protein [Nitratireductor sp. ZSWI3]
MKYRRLAVLLFLGLAAGLPAQAAETVVRPGKDWTKADQRAADAADRTERLLATRHQRWQQEQRELKVLIEPKPLKLDVPRYVPPRL